MVCRRSVPCSPVGSGCGEGRAHHVETERRIPMRRLERAELMIRNTQLPLAEIAGAMGLADQRHLTRHFHRLAGVALANPLERALISQAITNKLLRSPT